MVGIPEVLLVGCMVILPISCLANWWTYGTRLRAQAPLLPCNYTHSVPWGLLDMGVVVVLLAMLAGVGVALVRHWLGIDASAELSELSPRDQGTVFLSFATATLLATALSLLWLYLRFGKHAAIGFSWRHLGPDIELGVRWFTMLIVPVVLLQLLLTRWFPTKHPLIEMMRESGDLSLLPIAAFAAVLSAPLFEEVFFRLLFQGWLEKLTITMLRTRLGLAHRGERDTVLFGGDSPVDAANFGPGTRPNDQFIATNSDLPTIEKGASGDTQGGNRPVLWVPILVSSTLFSFAHFSHGPDWIPLFFLALGLGYLYQRTHRVQACITVHVLVNLLGVLQLWAAIRQLPMTESVVGW